MNITLICGHYLPDLGYIEVHLARALADLGHVVSVVTSSAVPRYVAHLQGPVEVGTEHDGKVKVIRLKPQFELGQVVTAKGVNAAVLGENPDLLIAIGLGKRFPKPVFGLGIPVITLFGDNLHSYAGTTFADDSGVRMERLKIKLHFAAFKASAYKKAVEKSDLSAAYTPESFEAAAGMLRGRFRKKLLRQDFFISLGFDPRKFYFDPELRNEARTGAGISPSGKVVITATRPVPEKRLEQAFSLFAALPEEWIWMTVGHTDTDYSREFCRKAEQALGKHRFKALPHADHKRLNALYNAADIALYTVPAISVFEAIGTGLPCVLPDVRSLSHIGAHADHVWYYSDFSDASVAEKVRGAAASPQERGRRAEAACAAFSWRNVARCLLEKAAEKGILPKGAEGNP